MQYNKSSSETGRKTRTVKSRRRFSACLLTILVILGMMTSVGSVAASASTNGKTQNDAVIWIKARADESWWENVNGDSYGCQCTDLIRKYYQFLGQSYVRGNACDYVYSSKWPSGWYMDSNPTPGAIVVWDAYSKLNANWTLGQYGHIGLVYAVSGSTVYTVETNVVEYDWQSGVKGYSNAKYCTRSTTYAKHFIHPDFAQSKYNLDVNISCDGVAYNSGISGLTFDVYINGSKAANDVTDFFSSYVKGTTYKVDDIKTTGALIYIGNSSYSGTIGSLDIAVTLPVKTGLTIKSETSGKYSVTIPANYSFPLYNSPTATSSKLTALANDHSYTFICNYKYVLSDGSTRYRYTENDGTYRYFTYSSQIKVSEIQPVTLKSKTTGIYKVVIPANKALGLYACATDQNPTYSKSASSKSYTMLCCDKYVFSDGSVKYGYYFSGADYRCFVFTKDMSAKEVTVKSKTTGNFKVTVPAGYELHYYTSAASTKPEYYRKASDNEYTLNCTEEVLYSDGSVRYGRQSGSNFLYFEFTSDMRADAGCTYGHNYITISDKLAKAATCTFPALYYKKCSRCGAYSSETFEKGEPLGHNYSAESDKLAKSATCTSPALYYKKCSRCGAYSSETFEKGKALEHNFVASDKLADPATCTTPARYFKVCSRCGTYSKPFDLAEKGSPLGHDYSAESNKLAKSATCTSPALYYKKCSRCSSCSTETFPKGSALGHTDESHNGYCDICGISMAAESGNSSDVQQDTASDTDNHNTVQCDCPCHSTGQIGIIWKVLMAICRFIGFDEFRYCSCGKSHY